MRSSKILLIALLPIVFAACGEPTDNRPGQPVAHRRAAFAKILRAFEPMGVQLRQQQYKADSFLEKARELSVLKDQPWQYFGPDTNYPPTHATARVWSEAERFEQERQGFLAASEHLLTAAESGEQKKVEAAYEALHERCRSCHKLFKE